MKVSIFLYKTNIKVFFHNYFKYEHPQFLREGENFRQKRIGSEMDSQKLEFTLLLCLIPSHFPKVFFPTSKDVVSYFLVYSIICFCQ